MGWIFRLCKENTAVRYRSIVRGFRHSRGGKDAQAGLLNMLNPNHRLQSFDLGSLHADSVARDLVVLAPRRRTLLVDPAGKRSAAERGVSAQTPGGQTIQYSVDAL